MRIIARRTLQQLCQARPEAEQALKSWYVTTRAAHWTSSADVKTCYVSALIIANDRIIFNIHGNRYRLITAVDYQYGIVYIHLWYEQDWYHWDASKTR